MRAEGSLREQSKCDAFGLRSKSSSGWKMRASILLALWSLNACAHHAKLVAPDASPASAYECSVGGQCRPASILDDARLNQSGTAFIVLPKECRGHFQQIVILDSDSDSPTVVATCATPEPDGVPTMGSIPAESNDGPIGEM